MSAENHIMMVLPHNISKLWSHALPLLQPVIETGKTHSSDDVRRALCAGNAQLWVQWNGKVQAAAVTEMIPYPLGLWLRIWLMAAIPMGETDWEGMKKHIVAFSQENSCAGIEHWGRRGWEKHPVHFQGVNSEFVIYRYEFQAKQQMEAA